MLSFQNDTGKKFETFYRSVSHFCIIGSKIIQKYKTDVATKKEKTELEFVTCTDTLQLFLPI